VPERPELAVDGQAEELPAEPPSAHSNVADGGNLARGGRLVQLPRTTALVAGASAKARIAVATEIATELDNVIKAQGLRTKIGRKKVTRPNGQEEWVDNFHVDIEAWQTLAAFLELAVVPVWTRRVIDPATGETDRVRYTVERTFYKKGAKAADVRAGAAEVDRVERAAVDGYSWEARVEVYKDGALVAAGEGMVSRAEESWRESDDHAVRSMAQTRAASKAIATAARWIVTLAGYAGTPASELSDDLAEASDELRVTAVHAVGYLLDGDVDKAEGVMERLVGQYEGKLPAVALQAVVIVAKAVKDQREEQAQVA
jgi:hypothetical protein